MKTLKWLVAALIIQLCLGSAVLHAQGLPGPPPTNSLNSWSFNDTNTWTSDLGYAWAQRGKRAGMPLRFAQVTLGHTSEPVALAYLRASRRLHATPFR